MSYRDGGWVLSPAYDINPVTPANGLHLNITDDDNSLDYELAMEVIDFFQLNTSDAHKIKDQVLVSVSNWHYLNTDSERCKKLYQYLYLINVTTRPLLRQKEPSEWQSEGYVC